MFFVLSKIFWLLAQPVSLTFLLVLSGWLFILLRRPHLGHLAIFTGVLLLFLSAFSSLGFLLIRPLEERFERQIALPETVGTIVVLGGATNGRVGDARQIPELTDAGDRLTEALRLANLYPSAKILLTGGIGLLQTEGESDAATGQRFLLGMGVAPERLVLEDQSKNTEENSDRSATLLATMAKPVLLVTSAFHMPRSVGLFRAAGVEVVPWPVDYRSTGKEAPGLDLASATVNLAVISIAVREWIGLAAYKITGRITDWFPGPALP